MSETEFKIGENVSDTIAYGSVKVMDIFRSVTNPDFYCYRVEDEDGNSYLASEEELMSIEQWDV